MNEWRCLRKVQNNAHDHLIGRGHYLITNIIQVVTTCIGSSALRKENQQASRT